MRTIKNVLNDGQINPEFEIGARGCAQKALRETKRNETARFHKSVFQLAVLRWFQISLYLSRYLLGCNETFVRWLLGW